MESGTASELRSTTETTYSSEKPNTPPVVIYGAGRKLFPYTQIVYVTLILSAYVLFRLYNLWFSSISILFVLGGPLVLALFVLVFIGFYIAFGHIQYLLTYTTPTRPIEYYLEITDENLKRLYSSDRRIPIGTFIEGYLNGHINVASGQTLLELFEARHDWAKFTTSFNEIQALLGQWASTFLNDDRVLTKDHPYNDDLGEDFYRAFLGDTMRYATGQISLTTEDTLEQMHERALESICKLLDFKAGERHLDINCDRGHLVCYAAKHYHTISTGIATDPILKMFATHMAHENGIPNARARFICTDYRDITDTSYDKISCAISADQTNAQHIFEFLKHLHTLLTDQGLLLFQATTSRTCWQIEDISWSIFSDNYGNPYGNKARPLHWYLRELETAGFAICSVKHMGVHAAATFARWSHHWEQHRTEIVAKYGERQWRTWGIYLAWTTLLLRQGGLQEYWILARRRRANGAVTLTA
jgi:cyclopropane fatty-acyl-phospholipid synthase-like methyltransferase